MHIQPPRLPVMAAAIAGQRNKFAGQRNKLLPERMFTTEDRRRAEVMRMAKRKEREVEAACGGSRYTQAETWPIGIEEEE